MKRFCLADILGTGEADVDEFRPAVADYAVGYACSMPSGPDGMPRNRWVLVEVMGGDDAQILLMSVDPRIDVLPGDALDTPVSQMDDLLVAAMRAALERRGIGADIVDPASLYGDVLDGIRLRASGEA